MIGASISRWTMSYFAMAAAWLLVALALMVAGIGFPAAHLAAPDTLVLVHVVCIGWLSVAMCGALLQFVPVLERAGLGDVDEALTAAHVSTLAFVIHKHVIGIAARRNGSVHISASRIYGC